MFFYDNYKKIKSINDLSVGDLFLFIYDKSKYRHSFLKKNMNSVWLVISKIDDKKVMIRRKNSKQIITLSNHKIATGFIILELKNKINVRYDFYYKKRYSAWEYIKLNLNRLKKWVLLR